MIADTLSRAYDKGNVDSSTEKDVDQHVNLIKEYTPVSDPMWDKIAKYTKEDPILSDVCHALEFGWDSARAQSLKPYYHFRAEIAEVDGVLMKGNKIIVPDLLKEEMLSKIHEGHMAIVKCQERARRVLYWPGISKDVEDKVNRCKVCLNHRYQQQKEPLQPHEIPSRPWVKIGADLFKFCSKDYLVVVHYTSNYPEVAKLDDLSSQTTVNHISRL